MSGSPLRQVSPLVSAIGAELFVPFPKRTLQNGILVGAFRLPGAALFAVVDDQGTTWSRANVTAPRDSRLEVWMRWPAGLKHVKSNPRLPEITWIETVPGPAGVRGVTARVCNGITLPLSGMALECRRGTKIGDAVQLMHDLLLRRPQQSVLQAEIG